MTRARRDPLGVVSTERQRLLVEEEMLRIAVTNQIEEAMEERDVKGADLAKRLRMTPGNVSQILSGARNLTLRTLARMGWALGCRWHADLREIDAKAESTPRGSSPGRTGWIVPTAQIVSGDVPDELYGVDLAVAVGAASTPAGSCGGPAFEWSH